MTIALGILGQQCLVIGADTEENYGAQKYQQGKIVSSWRGGDNPHGSICISGAGSAPHIEAASDEIVKQFRSFSATMEEFESWLANFVYEFYSRHVMPFVGRVSVDEVPEFELVIGARHEHTTRLWTTHKTTLNKNSPYVVIGISRGASQALLARLFRPLPSLNVAAILAAYVIRQAKLSSISVGLDTEIRFIYMEGHSVVPEEKIKAWEEIFAKYESVQREMFSYLSGYRELDIKLPGAVVTKKRELKDVLRDLRKMHIELSRVPIFAGIG
jgi:20S proteasome alpha/beta subunit